MKEKPTSAEIDEMRRVPRVPTQGTVRVLVHTKELHGVSENVSTAGVLLVAEESLLVSVELGAPGSGEMRTGRLVRIQKMEGGRSGLAIEFDSH